LGGFGGKRSAMQTLRLAVQKSGRLHDESLKLLKKAGIRIQNGFDQLKVRSSNFPLEVYFLRNSDIPRYLEDDVVDMAILGSNTMFEYGWRKSEVLSLGFSSCRLSIAIPKDSGFDSLSDLEGRSIATSYPNSLNAFLSEKGISADLHLIKGSVEIAPNIGLADAICDIVSSGSTLFKNGLKEVYKVLDSEACLYARDLKGSRKDLLEEVVFRMQTVLEAQDTKYILMNVPKTSIDKVTRILPVLKSPTIMPLAIDGWVSMHTVIKESSFWQVIKDLKQAGAEDILVMPIEKMIR
jgi:ATP phosphoribosyltransferase